MLPELAKADIVTVPVRYGSGTRVKILEAFAHRIPVVSTTPGAEGLGAEHGRHLLLADTAQSFADACEELLTDVGLRVTLTEAAHQLLIERHQWTRARTVINDMALAVARQQPAER
jgi:glycosyltransferase involved in cell wall biosynthesis